MDGVLLALTSEGLLSDDRFAEGFVRARVENGYGPARIQYELRERGIDEVLSAQCLGSYESEWPERMAAVRQKRFGRSLPEEQKERARQARYLQYRGFTPEQVWALLDDRLSG